MLGLVRSAGMVDQMSESNAKEYRSRTDELGLEEIDDVSGMSNFDHSINDGFEEQLRTGKLWGRHAGWNFNGRVWFADGKFHEEVWVYRVIQKIVSADTLRELMDAVNDEFGSE
jgi:hypothetical protein